MFYFTVTLKIKCMLYMNMNMNRGVQIASGQDTQLSTESACRVPAQPRTPVKEK
jgi:hypothetical protein